MPKHHGNLQTKLFLGKGTNTHLVVAFGGSEGGNTFSTEKTQAIRQKFLDRGFHFLSIAYFGSKNLPKSIDRISLNAVYDTIINISKNIEITSNNIVLLGASRGGELVLNLAAKYDFKGVIALVPSSVTVPNLNNKIAISSWTLKEKEIPFLNVNEKTIKSNDWHAALEEALLNLEDTNPAFIPIEDIHGFIFLSSGKSDTAWPSYNMCQYMEERLKKNHFLYPYTHQAFDNGHNPSTHWEEVFNFLDQHIE